MTTSATVVAARGLTRHYRRGSEIVSALDGVDLEIGAGEIVALVGPSGSGKTTLLNLLCGWEPADSGELRWLGDPMARLVERPWRDVAIVPQALGLLDDLTAEENVRLPARLVGYDDRDRFGQLADSLSIQRFLQRRPRDTSLGEQQRTCVARALLLAPRLLLADEPTAHQDETNAARILGVLREAAARGTACLIATHSPELRSACDRVLSLRDGRLV